MKRPLILHLKAALFCAFVAVALSLPLLWVPLLPAWQGWRPPVVSPRAEAVLALVMALWVAWCVVDIPRRSLKVLIWVATLWLLGSGIWLAGLFGFSASSLVPVTAAGLAGAGGLLFSLTPAGSRRARWQSLVGNRVAPEFLRERIDERHLEEAPRSEILAVVEVLWPGDGQDETLAWTGMADRATAAARHFQNAGGYLERCDGEGARFVFGCWGLTAAPASVVAALWNWVAQAGGCAAVTRGECVTGVGRLPTGARWTISGAPLRRAARMAASARGYAAKVLVEDSLAADLGDAWVSRRIAWWDFEGEHLLLRELLGPAADAPPGTGDNVRRWDYAWDAFWSGEWMAAENGFGALARETEDASARIFALRSQAARRQESET
ncbi:MAG: hypothetical protein IAE97_07640 [Chthoniobacterales bacterium]|nr:hypothetical protein [Chthoniobacterales bacterium]